MTSEDPISEEDRILSFWVEMNFGRTRLNPTHGSHAFNKYRWHLGREVHALACAGSADGTALPGSPAAAPSRSLHLMPGCHLEPPGSRVLPNYTSHWSCCLPRSPPLPAWQWGRPRTCPDSSLLPWSLDYSSLSLGYTSKSLTTWLSPSRKSSRTRLGEARGPSATPLPEVRHVLVTYIVNE